MEIYKNIISPVLNRLDSEKMHTLARDALALAEEIPNGDGLVQFFAHEGKRITDRRLATIIGSGYEPSKWVWLDNRLIVAAGWDKKGVAAESLYWLGAAATSVGAVLEHPQNGNEKPRQWYLGDGVAVNRLGFNSPGMEKVGENLKRYKDKNHVKLGINIGINKEVKPADAPKAFAAVTSYLYEDMDWAEVNVSSPNTKNLRDLQDPIYLRDINQAVKGAMREKGCIKPIYNKIAPDLSDEEVKGIIKVTVDEGLSGMVVANTTVDNNIKGSYDGIKGKTWSEEPGGLSGADAHYRYMTTRLIALVRKEVEGVRFFEIQGVGAVDSFEADFEKHLAGANVRQLNTAIRGVGLSVFGKINRGWIKWMDEQGISSFDELDQLVGSEAGSYLKP